PINFAEHDGGALVERQSIERVLQARGQLFLSEDLIRPRPDDAWELAVRRDVRVERDLIGFVAPPPEAVPVARLVDGNAVDPGAEARLAPESMNGGEDAKEHLVRKVNPL